MHWTETQRVQLRYNFWDLCYILYMHLALSCVAHEHVFDVIQACCQRMMTCPRRSSANDSATRRLPIPLVTYNSSRITATWCPNSWTGKHGVCLMTSSCIFRMSAVSITWWKRRLTWVQFMQSLLHVHLYYDNVLIQMLQNHAKLEHMSCRLWLYAKTCSVV